MGNTVVGWNNYVTSAALVAGSQAANMPPENLQDDSGSPSIAWQTLAGVKTAAAGATLRITPAATGQTWRAFLLARTNLTTAAVVTVALYTNPSTLVWSGTASAIVAGYGQSVIVAPTDKVADYCIISIDDTTNTDNFINVPLAFAGPVWFPATGMTWQTTFGRDSLVDEVVSRGGQEYPTPRWLKRRRDVAMDSLTSPEVWADAQEIDRIGRVGGNMLLLPDSTSATIGNETLFGRYESVSDIGYVALVAGLFTWRFRIRERI